MLTMVLNCGHVTSGAHVRIRMSHLPNLLIIVSITIKKICKITRVVINTYKVGDFHQEFDFRIVLMPDKLLLSNIFPLLWQWH